MNKVEKKRQREQHVVEEMIQLYCRKNHSKEERQGRKTYMTFSVLVLGTKAVTQVKKGARNKPVIKSLCYRIAPSDSIFYMEDI